MPLIDWIELILIVVGWGGLSFVVWWLLSRLRNLEQERRTASDQVEAFKLTSED